MEAKTTSTDTINITKGKTTTGLNSENFMTQHLMTDDEVEEPKQFKETNTELNIMFKDLTVFIYEENINKGDICPT